MKIYKISPGDESARIVGIHRWNLPGVECSTCGNTWATAGLEYPTIDLSDFRNEAEYRESRSEPLAKYCELRKSISDRFPELARLEPGTLFGPLSGRVSGASNGFVWQTPWTVLLTSDAMEKFARSDFRLPKRVEARINSLGHSSKLFELELPLVGIIPSSILGGRRADSCHACGFVPLTLRGDFEIDLASLGALEADIGLFRLHNFPTIVAATERFRDFVERSGIDGARFEQVRLN